MTRLVRTRWLGMAAMLIMEVTTLAGPRLEVLEVSGKTLQGNPLGDPTSRRVALFIPQQVQPGQAATIVYYLPGYGSSSENYIPQGDSAPFAQLVQRLADEGRPLIIAVPDCRNRFGGSQYLNSTAQGNYADYVAEEIVAAVEAKYPAAKGRAGRIIAGHSSGGYGALMFGMARQTLFGAVVALSPDSDFEVTHRPLVEEPEMRAVTPKMVEACTAPKGAKAPPSELVELVFGLSAAYTPVGSEQPGRFRWLYDEKGQFQKDVWQQWLDKDPLLLVRANTKAFAPDQRIYLDGASHDEWGFNVSARKICDVLHARGASVTFAEPPGSHSDGVPERLGEGLRWALRDAR